MSAENKLSLNQLILQVAQKGIKLQNNDGSMNPGRNGPYGDYETPVRNTSHWTITFSKAFELTDEHKFREAAMACIQYLENETTRPNGYTFWHRNSPTKDKCNGLIGQAWTIEALTVAASTFNLPHISRLAQDIFFLHPFNTHRSLWHKVEIDGRILDIDETFNHQLWLSLIHISEPTRPY